MTEAKRTALPCPICWNSDEVDAFEVEIIGPGGTLHPYLGYYCRTCDLCFENDDVVSAGLMDDDGYVLVDLGGRFGYNGLRDTSVDRRPSRPAHSESPTFGEISRVKE